MKCISAFFPICFSASATHVIVWGFSNQKRSCSFQRTPHRSPASPKSHCPFHHHCGAPGSDRFRFHQTFLCYAQERLRTRVQEIAASRSSRCPFHTAFGQQNQAEAVACQIKAPIALITNQSLASLLRIAEEKVIYITDTQHRLGHQVAKEEEKRMMPI